MRKMIAMTCVLAMLAIRVAALQSPAQTPTSQKMSAAKNTKTSSKKNRAAVVPAQQLPAQTMPPLPATLMNSAPVNPHVTMEGGLLTIDAPNSTLSDVLSGVHTATGAAIEGATPSERVAVKLGPGNPEQVIAALLRGTLYDYVILGSLGKQDVVTRVLLTQQASQNAGAGGQPAQPPATLPQAKPEQVTDESMPERTVPDDASTQPDTDPDQAQQQPQDPNQPKTPEQLFKELQQLEQQKQPR